MEELALLTLASFSFIFSYEAATKNRAYRYSGYFALMGMYFILKIISL